MLKNLKVILFPSLIAITIIMVLDLLTNSINTETNKWDFIYYISMAKSGFNAENLASPFAYRYITTELVRLLSVFGIPIENGFRVITYIGTFTQLVGIYIFIKWLSGSNRSSWGAMLITAFSTFNIKFLLFDTYRPDHLAYLLILLQTYFAFSKKFAPLLILTFLGSQLREFNVIPLIAYLFMQTREKREASQFVKQVILSIIFLFPAIALPRLLIPVKEDFQFIGFSSEKLLSAIIYPLIPSVTINFIFSVLAYFLPIFLIAHLQTIKNTYIEIQVDKKKYILGYSILVLCLSFFGGTDFNRFATFLFLPQIILFSLLMKDISNQKLIFVLICVIIFNRLWVHFPDWDIQAYRSFYGGFSLVLNQQTGFRILELVGFIILGYMVNRKESQGVSSSA